MIIQNESTQAKIDSRVHKLLLRDMKTKAENKDQPTSYHKNKRKLKNNRIIRTMRNITRTMDPYFRN